MTNFSDSYIIDFINSIDVNDISKSNFIKNLLFENQSHYSKIFNLALSFSNSKNFSNAILLFKTLKEFNPHSVNVIYNLGLCYFLSNDLDLADREFDFALSLDSKDSGLLFYKALILIELSDFSNALLYLEKLVLINDKFEEAWVNLGFVLNKLCFFTDALKAHDHAISLNSFCSIAIFNKANSFAFLNSYFEAIEHYDKAIQLKPDYAEAWSNKGEVFNLLKLHVDSANSFFRAFLISGANNFYFGRYHHQKMMACDWSNYDEELFQQFDFLRNNFEVSHPFGFQAICESEQMLQSCATIYSSKNFPDKSHFFLHHFKKITSTVKVGFLCGEFRDHATSHLMIRVWELFNLERFDIFAFDSGWNDSSKYRQRIQKAFGNNFFNIRNQSDEDAASLIHNLNINILINLNGFFGESRQGIFSYKPAPIQVNYLGFPGTIGAPYIDYLIADSTVIPNSSRQFYTEKVVYLPNCYQANDNLRSIICNPPCRSDYGLPENAFVFACFNNNYKITPKFFSLWIDILKNVPHSVLWLIFDNADAKMNLLRFAELSGISKERVIFSERVDLSQHLSRHILADLFLDTLPYNAHTTASDALWAGLPIVTMTGNSFPGRVATSLLYSIGLPELVAKSYDEYKQIAINLALSKNELATLKNKLKINRNNSILFDSKLFTVNFENALLGMVDRYNKNLPPDHISF